MRIEPTELPITIATVIEEEEEVIVNLRQAVVVTTGSSRLRGYEISLRGIRTMEVRIVQHPLVVVVEETTRRHVPMLPRTELPIKPIEMPTRPKEMPIVLNEKATGRTSLNEQLAAAAGPNVQLVMPTETRTTTLAASLGERVEMSIQGRRTIIQEAVQLPMPEIPTILIPLARRTILARRVRGGRRRNQWHVRHRVTSLHLPTRLTI